MNIVVVDEILRSEKENVAISGRSKFIHTHPFLVQLINNISVHRCKQIILVFRKDVNKSCHDET